MNDLVVIPQTDLPTNFKEVIEEYEYPESMPVTNDGMYTGIVIRFKVHVRILNDGFVQTEISDKDYDTIGGIT